MLKSLRNVTELPAATRTHLGVYTIPSELIVTSPSLVMSTASASTHGCGAGSPVLVPPAVVDPVDDDEVVAVVAPPPEPEAVTPSSPQAERIARKRAA